MRASSVVLLPHAPASVAVARRRLGSELFASGVLEAVIDDVNVVISELLSNALRHARPLPSGQIRLTWARNGDLIEVAVTDGGAMTEPRRSRPTLSSLGGRGLGIVETLAEYWGVRYEDGGTTVWAVLRSPQAAAARGRADADAPQATVRPMPGHMSDVSQQPPAGNLLHGTR